MSTLRLIPAIVMPVLLLAASGLSQPVIFPTPLSPRIANYTIDVRLNAAERTLTGHEVLVWHNTTSQPAAELRFHLYLNGFRNSRATFMKESGGQMRGSKLDKDGWGYIDVTSIRTGSGPDLSASIGFIQPDDANTDDRTVFRLPLPSPVPPGGMETVTIDFIAKLPSPPFARSGAKSEYFLVGQWFPKIGVLTETGWNCHQYHATSEFFSDFGVYDVKMTVPEANVLGATGIPVSVTKNSDGTATHYYHAEDVHDFAWTTSPEFREFTGKAENVNIRVLMQPDHADQGPRHVQAAKTAIEYFHKWYGTYPYPNLTVVDPRRGAGGSGGMEYPTFITAGTTYGVPDGVRLPEMVIIHEFGHNYWYGLVASNEFEESWLDEGINTYSEIQIFHDAYGPSGDMISCGDCRLNDADFQRGQYLFVSDRDRTVRNAWEYSSVASYGVNSYAKPGLLLSTLQNYLGTETMQRIMRTYFERWKFRHPTSRDFINVANEVAGQNLDWFFDQALFSNAVLDYSVASVNVEEVRREKGYTGSQPAVLIDTTTADTSARLYRSTILVRRLGTFTFPVEVAFLFSDGARLLEQWDGKDIWKKYTFTRNAKCVAASVDPDHKVLLDVNVTNNSKTVSTQVSGIGRMSSRLLFWLQSLLDQPELMLFVELFAQ